jgi:hypothetical protein
MSLRSLFRTPTPIKITGRTSSITNAFINSILPTIEPTEAQVAEALSILGMDESSFSCSYCGDTVSEWDHFRPCGLLCRVVIFWLSCDATSDTSWQNWGFTGILVVFA